LPQGCLSCLKPISSQVNGEAMHATVASSFMDTSDLIYSPHDAFDGGCDHLSFLLRSPRGCAFRLPLNHPKSSIYTSNQICQISAQTLSHRQRHLFPKYQQAARTARARRLDDRTNGPHQGSAKQPGYTSTVTCRQKIFPKH